MSITNITHGFGIRNARTYDIAQRAMKKFDDFNSFDDVETSLRKAEELGWVLEEMSGIWKITSEGERVTL